MSEEKNLNSPTEESETLVEAEEFIYNRRKYPRRRFLHKVALLIEGQYLILPSLEISEGGILALTDAPYNFQKQIVLTIFLPENLPQAIRSEIRYSHPEADTGKYKTGIQFLNLEFSFKKKIREFVSAKSEKEALSEQASSQLFTTN